MVFDAIAKIISEKMDIDKDSITMESTLEDMKIDSLDMVEILMDIEDELDVELEDVESISSIAELCELIESKK